jgi:hypothetical protein
MINVKSKAREVFDRGFCVLESAWSSKECALAERLLLNVWEKRGRPPLAGFGMAVHPLLEHAPDFAPLFDRPVALDVLAEVFQDEPRLAHTGARLSNEESDAQIGWHEHYAWDHARLAGRPKIERVLFSGYTRGSNADTGPLVVLPRRFDAPAEVPPLGLHDDWPGQLIVEMPPGAAIIFDTALWHAAKRGTKPGFRFLFGTHCQGWSNPMPHREDNKSTRPDLRVFKERSPRLRRFLDGK